METVAEYVIRIFIASAICSVLTAILSEKASKGLIKVICGIFMTVTIISPLKKIDFPNVINQLKHFEVFEYDDAIAAGVSQANQSQEVLIKERVTAYILEKAASLGMNIDIDLTTSGEPSYIPNSIKIYGNYSPYSRKVLTAYLSEEIGIPEEYQHWS